MITNYKYIYFEQVVNGTDERYGDLYVCKNKRSKEQLGTVLWYPKWKQYVFSQYTDGVIFSHDCLADIIDFIKQLKKRR